MNPYACFLCGGDLGHTLDCPARPENLERQARAEGGFAYWLGGLIPRQVTRYHRWQTRRVANRRRT